MTVFRTVALAALLALLASAAGAATYVPVEDSDVYSILSRLETEGVLRSGLLDVKPISRAEAMRLLQEAETNTENSTEFLRSLVRSLRERLGPEPPSGTLVRPLDTAYVKYVYTSAGVQPLRYGPAIENEQLLNRNNDGDLYQRGSNERAGFTSRLENWGPLSLAVDPGFRYPTASYTGYPDTQYAQDDVTVRRAYAVLGMGWDLIIGKDSQWWGPGYNGAVLLSDNAEPLTMVKLTNPEPVRLPWFLDSLGPFRFTFFLANLEKARPVAEPHLYGMRFDFKPSAYVDIGLERTAILGGKGQPDDFATWRDSLLAQSHGGQDYRSAAYVNIDDERAGMDFKITIPWHVQPMQIYLEGDGEDVSSHLPVPQDWAFVGGVYLPRILGAEQIDFRAEWARSKGRRTQPYIWYTHGIWSSYTYEGNVMGHYMGTDSQDYFTELSYLFPERNARVFVQYERMEHNLMITASHETVHQASTGVHMSLTQHVDASASCGYGFLRNAGNIASDTKNIVHLETGVTYRF